MCVGGDCIRCFLLTNSPHVLQIAYRKEKFSLFSPSYLETTPQCWKQFSTSITNFLLGKNFQDKSQRMRLVSPLHIFLIRWIKIRFCNISSHNNNSMAQMERKTSCLRVRESPPDLWTTIDFIECTCILFTFLSSRFGRVFGLWC